jgi:hypothetical protein
VRVEFLFWSGCPSHPSALADLRDAMEQEGFDPEHVIVTQMATDEQAADAGFVGSPTIRIDGRDVQPTGDEPTGLTCRVYRRRDGRYSPNPDPADLRDALRAASRAQSGVTS